MSLTHAGRSDQSWIKPQRKPQTSRAFFGFHKNQTPIQIQIMMLHLNKNETQKSISESETSCESTINSNKLKVIIVGAGIGGAAFAVACEKHGIDFQIYERAKGFDYYGSIFAIQPNGVKAMSDISPEVILEARKMGTSQDEGNFVMQTNTGALLGKPYEDKHGKPVSDSMGVEPGIIMRRQDFHSLLLKSFDQSKLHLDHEVTGLGEPQANGRRAVMFQNGHCETADVVIGADGVHSALRSYVTDANAEVSYHWVSGHAKAGAFPASLMPRKDRRLHFGHGGDFPFFFAASTKSGDVEWGAVVPENRSYSLKEIRDGYATYEPSVRAILKGCATKEFRVFQSTKMKPLDSWHTGNLVLLGDAVHPISQVSGQGANMAIEDARRLAIELNAYRLGRTKSIEEAIQSYELCRIGRVNRIIKDNARRTNSMFVKGRLAIVLRNTFLRFLFRVVQVKPGDWIDKKFDQPPASAVRYKPIVCSKVPDAVYNTLSTEAGSRRPLHS